ncbi:MULTISPECIES: YafY family protein [unclassified Leucobacter]|uniref:helix-turn-helix transcriptional regulator n=1 Tax=unclassified Leucobacter TaxID=2621730 RepID=UPI00165DFA27|nr:MULTISPECIES: WYL domain-containing protein [unclassified Leucobacter]MBC9928428.1 WYL domain-containing protein [Leucobacter sp. cx-169]
MRANLTAPNRVILLLSLVAYLQDRGPTPILELAETFDVEPKVLRALAEFLGTAGVPGETQTYQHEDLFDIDWHALEHDDVLSLVRVVAIDDTPRFAASEVAVLLAGLHVLAPMLPPDDGAAARSAALKLGGESGGEHAVISVSEESTDPQAAVLAGAIAAGMRVSFAYRDARGGETARSVEPLLLQQRGVYWYLRGYCLDRGEERSFRLDRMSHAHALPERSLRRATPGQADESPSASVWSGTTVTLCVRERALPSLAGYGAEVIAAGADEPLDGSSDRAIDESWVRVQVELAHVDTAARIAATAPGDVIVEAPAAARAAVESWAEQALAQYDD